MIDSDFTNGAIAVKEKSLLGDKVFRLAEGSAEEALRALSDSGFGQGAEGGIEQMCRAEEEALDAFIREYAPGKTELYYLLSPRDFYNAKAVVKAQRAGIDYKPLLAPDGLIPAEVIAAAVKDGDFKALGEVLGEAVKSALEAEKTTGAEIGARFDRAQFEFLTRKCRFDRFLSGLIAGKADRLNVLTAMRSQSFEFAEKLFVAGGTVKTKNLKNIFSEDADKAARALEGTAAEEFYKLCLAAKQKGLPFIEAERESDTFESGYFSARKYELEGRNPFLYYVLRRRADINNARTVVVCLNAGVAPQEIKRRLRAA